jgi:hypothetical protein
MSGPVVETCGEVMPVPVGSTPTPAPAGAVFPSPQEEAWNRVPSAALPSGATGQAPPARGMVVVAQVRRLPVVVQEAGPAPVTGSPPGAGGIFGAPPAVGPPPPTYNARRPAPGAAFPR